jgi:hypothetical protein
VKNFDSRCCIGNLNNLFSDRSYIAEPASRQAHVRLVKISVLLRMARAKQRSEARDWLAVAALARAAGRGWVGLEG